MLKSDALDLNDANNAASKLCEPEAQRDPPLTLFSGRLKLANPSLGDERRRRRNNGTFE
jgi:hypothetical protein